MGFQDALQTTLGFEGGYSNDSTDRGGATVNGISSNNWPQDFSLQKQLLDAGKTDLAKKHLEEFYKKNFWDQIGGDSLPEPMQKVAFDTAVNNGVGNARKMLEASGGDPEVMLSIRQGFDNAIAANDPSQAGHESGWKNRIDSLRVKVAQNTPVSAPQSAQTASDASDVVTPPLGSAPIDSHLDAIISAPPSAALPPSEPIPSHLDAILGGAQTPTAPAVEAPPAPRPPTAAGATNLLGNAEEKFKQFMDKAAAGAPDVRYRLMQGINDPLVGVSQGVAHALDYAVPGSANDADASVNQREADYQKNHPVDGMDLARMAGNVVSPMNAMLPLKAIAGMADGGSALMRMAKGAMSGGAMAAAQPTQTAPDGSYAGEKIFQSGTGAAMGGVIPAVGNVVSGLIKPSVNADAQKLINEGVKTSMGQTSGGGMIKGLEDKATSLPIIGGMIKDAQAKGIEGMNRAAVNRGLTQIGDKLPDDVKTGHDAIAYAQQKFNDAYEKVLPNISGNLMAKTTNSFGQDLIGTEGTLAQDFSTKVGDMLKEDYYTMHDDMKEKLQKILRKEVVDRVNPDGTFNGDQAKTVESRLTQMGRTYSGSTDTDTQQLYRAIDDVKALFRDQMAGNNPEAAAALKNVNRGYANFKIAQRAAASKGVGESGVFTPSQLMGEVRASDRSVSKGNFAKGKALMQDLAISAKNVLPNSIPNSGSVDRGLIAGLIGMVAGGGSGALLAHPIAGTALGALAGTYSEIGQTAARKFMTARPAGAGALSELVRKATDTASLSPYAH